MHIYYLGLACIVLLFIGSLFISFKFQKYTILQLGHIFGITLLASTIMGLGYYRYGAIKPLQSLFAYREIHMVLSELQKKPPISQHESEQALSALYQHLPQTEYVHAKMGEVYLASNLPIQAENAFASALKIHPSYRDYAYGFYYAQSLRYKGILPNTTIGALIKLIEQDPKDNGFLNLLAVNSFQTKQYVKAIAYWKQIELNNPEEKELIEFMIKQAQSQLVQPA